MIAQVFLISVALIWLVTAGDSPDALTELGNFVALVILFILFRLFCGMIAWTFGW